MVNLSEASTRVKRYLRKRFGAVVESVVTNVTDPRGRRGRRHTFASMITVILAGLVAGCKTLREVERLAHELGKGMSDTALALLLPRIDPDGFPPALVQQVRRMQRRKQLVPVGLPISVATVDGKSLGAVFHDVNGRGHPCGSKEGERKFHVMVLRATLSCAAGKPIIGQLEIPGKKGEPTMFPVFARQLVEQHGDLVELLDVDAGMLSRSNFRFVDQELERYFVGGLKGNQPNLSEEAQRILEPMAAEQKPEAVTAWEPHKGKEIRRKLYRTTEMNGYLDWQNLRQCWLVVQETRTPVHKIDRRLRRKMRDEDIEWTTEIEHRYFVTNVPLRRLSALQILLVVRNHWAVENDCFNSLDVQWQEDRPALCATGNAMVVLAWLRVLAYNMVQYLRKRHVRKRYVRKSGSVPMPFVDIFAAIKRALPGVVAPGIPPGGPVPTPT